MNPQLLAMIRRAIIDDGESASIRTTGGGGGGGGGTEYTEGDVDATFTGGIALVEGAANTAVTLKQPTQPTDTQPVSVASLPLPSGAATSAKQDALLAELQLKADLTETQPVSLASVPSHNVTNAGTFATQSTLQSGTNIVGGTYPTPSGAAAQALSNDTSTAYEASSVTKASAGTVYGVTGYNSKTSAQFFQFFNSTTVPADATAPVITIYVSAQSNFSIDFGVYGRRFSTGIAWSNSSTGATKTIGSADMFVDVNYI